MSGPRVDPYATIHKVLRALLGQTITKLGQASFEARDGSSTALDAAIETLALLHEHAEVEERSFHPTLATRSKAMVEALEADHHEIEPALDALAERAKALKDQPDGASRSAAGQAFYLDFAAASARYLVHLHHEETVGKRTFQELFTDSELLEMQAKMRASMGPAKLAQWAAHMFAPISHAERVGVLASLKQSAPPPAFAAMLGIAEKSLPKPDYDRLVAALR
ncbi:MAG: hemerythrin domain-containing protein [Deltaproteobacteria bacterium]|nr:hemerythrin domain-containing protein [Deltaproteobacteria bacterium]